MALQLAATSQHRYLPHQRTVKCRARPDLIVRGHVTSLLSRFRGVTASMRVVKRPLRVKSHPYLSPLSGTQLRAILALSGLCPPLAQEAVARARTKLRQTGRWDAHHHVIRWTVVARQDAAASCNARRSVPNRLRYCAGVKFTWRRNNRLKKPASS